ncbi:MAG: FG-GAP repeat domain-containing protein [Romboutsia sp.]|uniref:FG-GAP repeat domain-containing protein n=1 Tax=Romboutsia sp. TaxID=1965302 RepID=UPI003F32F750
MKLFKLMTCASILVLLTTGCSFTSESPEELMKEKPKYNESKEQLYKAIEQKIPEKSSLLLPANSSECGKINEIDLDSDGKDELVVFEKKENLSENTNQVGFMILRQKDDGGYIENDSNLEDGDSIEYADFYDLNNDGNKEIILLIKDKNITNMYIYSLKNGEISKIDILNPRWIKGKEEFSDMMIKIGYINDDSKLDILMIHHDSKTNKAYASIANFEKDINLIDYVELDNVKSLKNLYITIGTIATEKVGESTLEKKGVFLDIPIVQDNNYTTQILYMQNNKLKKAFKDDDKSITKPYYIPVEDVNNDKVIDIPIVTGSGNGNMYTPKLSATINWNRWNGKEDENSGLVFTSQIYYNYQYNYRLFIPNNLASNSYIESAFQGKEVLFRFYYYDKQNTKPKNLFTISVINKNQIDDKNSPKNAASILLGETNEYNFVLYQNDVKELKKLKIDIETIKEYFSLIYK